jgi:hypothetical protein
MQDQIPTGPTCATCKFSVLTEMDARTLQRMRVCKWGPPNFTLVSDPRTGQHMPACGWPMVRDDQFCHQHKEIDAPKLLT